MIATKAGRYSISLGGGMITVASTVRMGHTKEQQNRSRSGGAPRKRTGSAR